MKKFVAFLIALCLLFSLSACAPSESPDSGQMQAADGNTSTGNYKNLTGAELLKAVFSNMKKPDNIYVKTKLSAADVPEIEMAMYISGQNRRFETHISGKNNITIINEEDGFAYSYTEGESIGTKVKSETTAEATAPFSDGLEMAIAEDEDFEGLVVARVEKLNDKEVVYSEFKNFDEDLGGDVTQKLWYSVEYRYPLKMEIVTDAGEVTMSLEVVEIEANKDFSSKMIPPKDVEFTTY